MNVQSFQFSSEYENVGPACAEIIDLVAQALEPEKTIELQIALNEALNNVIEHSYEEQGGRPVDVRCHIYHDKVQLEIQDVGKGMPNGWVVPEAAFQSTSGAAVLEDLPEGGMGLRLIEECIDEVSYERSGRRNTLTLKKFK